jgi:hypothetical protein
VITDGVNRRFPTHSDGRVAFKELNEVIVKVRLAAGDDVDDHDADGALEVSGAFYREGLAMSGANFICGADQFDRGHKGRSPSERYTSTVIASGKIAGTVCVGGGGVHVFVNVPVREIEGSESSQVATSIRRGRRW